MDQIQNQPVEPLTPAKAPTLLLVISTLIIVLSSLALLASLALALFTGPYGLILALVPSVLYVAFIIVAVGLRRLRRWALYTYTIVTILSVLYSSYQFVQAAKPNIISVIIPFLILIYLWSIHTKFSSTPRT